MKMNTTRILAIVLAVVIFAGAFYIYRYKPFAEDNKPAEPGQAEETAAVGPPVTPVRAMIARTGPLLESISINGSTLPREEVTVTSEVPGKITEILFQEGTYVKKGTPLVQLDDEELRAQRKRMLVQKELTSKIAERMKNLYDKEGVSLQEYEIAEAEAEQVRAELALLDVQLDKRVIKAPFNGVLGLRQVSEGSYLSPGSPIVNLVSTNPIDLEFSVPEKYSQTLRRGNRVAFSLDGSDQIYQATIIAKEPNIDPDTRTLGLKASTPNPNGRILPGAFASVTVNLKEYENTILIPTQAVIPEMGGKKVFLYRNGKVDAVPIETGVRKDAMIQVLEGLSEGDTVITTGVLQIRPGADVQISHIEP